MKASDALTYALLLVSVLAILAAYAYEAAKWWALPSSLDVFPLHEVYTELEWEMIRMASTFADLHQWMIYTGLIVGKAAALAFDGLAGLVTTGYEHAESGPR